MQKHHAPLKQTSQLDGGISDAVGDDGKINRGKDSFHGECAVTRLGGSIVREETVAERTGMNPSH